MSKTVLSISFSIGLFIVLILMAWEASNFQDIASYFPLYISLFAIVLITIEIFNQVRKAKKEINDEEEKISRVEASSVIKYILWFVGYLLIILLAGLLIGTSIFLLLFLTIETKYKVIKVIPITAVTITIIIAAGWAMDLKWPSGIIFM